MDFLNYIQIKGIYADEFISGEHERDIARAVLNAAKPIYCEVVRTTTAADGTTYTTRRAYGALFTSDELREALAFYNAFERCGHLNAALEGTTALIIAEFMEVVE